jgi:hypothetical protein
MWLAAKGHVDIVASNIEKLAASAKSSLVSHKPSATKMIVLPLGECAAAGRVCTSVYIYRTNSWCVHNAWWLCTWLKRLRCCV